MEFLIFLLKTLGLGLITGFVLGYLFKKISKILLFLIALIVVLVVVFGHNEILDIDWLSVKGMFEDFYDKYFDHYHERLMIFMRNMPFTVGLIIGALFGLRKG